MDSILLQSILGVLAKKVIVPSDFQGQVEAVRLMQQDDVSGLVDSLTDFAVNTACVDFSVETTNPKFTETLKKWLDEINIEYQGKIPIGIKELAREYFKERWKYSSFAVLKIVEWNSINGINVPTKMFFVDGESIHAEDKDKKTNNLHLFNYDYYLGLGKGHKLSKNVIFDKTNGRWFDKYPIPYSIKRGVYHNWKIIESLKSMQTKILDQVIPYMLLIKKGFKGSSPDNSKFYTDPQLKEVLNDLQNLVTEINTNVAGDKSIKSPTRATNFDEEIKHLIPDLKTIFDPVLFAQAERNILSGLGFIDVIQGVSDTRKESILNPKIFVEEVKSGIEGFKQILNQLVYLIIEKNKGHRKYINSEFYITASPISIFQTDKFKSQMRLLWKNGQLSNQTYCEIVGEVDFRTEKHRREKEAKNGTDITMYPHLTENKEGVAIDLPGEKEMDVNDNPIDRDKIDDPEKYDMSSKYSCTCPKCGTKKTAPEGKHCNEIKCPKCGSSMRRTNRPGTGRPDKSPNAKKTKADLEIAPYQNVKDLPASVKKNLSPGLQRTFLRVFNDAYKQYQNDSKSFRIAWGVIKKIAKQDKNGKWVRKPKAKVSKAMVEEIVKGIKNKEEK